jgi:hypothetical protein
MVVMDIAFSPECARRQGRRREATAQGLPTGPMKTGPMKPSLRAFQALVGRSARLKTPARKMPFPNALVKSRIKQRRAGS